MSVYDLAAEGAHVFPVDHPSLPKCAGLHKSVPCDGKRGKHPSVAWGHAATRNPKMIATWFEGTTRNVGISCGPSGLVVLDEDADGALQEWSASSGVELPETYTVTTGKGRHVYYRYDHAVAPIKNSAAKLFGTLAIDVRGEGGFVVAAGSTHEEGRTYEDNGAQIVPLLDELAQRLLTAQTKTPETPVTEDFSSSPNNTPIPYRHRHKQLLAYAGRLRNAGLDHAEADTLFRKRWELCEQPPGQEAPYERAKQTILDDIYTRYEAGRTPETVYGMPRLWNATDLRPTTQPRWLAKNRLPRAAVSLLIGDEGIGKSLLWVLVITHITTGKPFPEFGIPARGPATVILVLTEDDWVDHRAATPRSGRRRPGDGASHLHRRRRQRSPDLPTRSVPDHRGRPRARACRGGRLARHRARGLIRARPAAGPPSPTPVEGGCHRHRRRRAAAVPHQPGRIRQRPRPLRRHRRATQKSPHDPVRAIRRRRAARGRA